MVRILDTSGYMWIPRGTTCSNKPKVWHFHHTPLELGLSLATKWAPQLGLLSLGNCFHLFGDSHLLNLSSREHVYVLHHLTWIDIVSLRFSQVSDSIWYRSGFSLFLTSIRMLGTSWKQLLKSNDIKAIMGYYGQHGAILHLVWSFGRPGILETKSRRGDCGRMDFAAEDTRLLCLAVEIRQCLKMSERINGLMGTCHQRLWFSPPKIEPYCKNMSIPSNSGI
jgi:hypothetical protein